MEILQNTRLEFEIGLMRIIPARGCYLKTLS